MALLVPLPCVRPPKEMAAKIATGPHSFCSKEELRRKVADNPFTYTRIAHPKAVYGDVPDVYRRAREAFREWVQKGYFIEDREPCYYMYRLEGGGHAQTGLVGRTSVDEILEGRIHAHENIRESKLKDLMEHMETCGLQVGGPILTAFRSCPEVSAWIRQKEKEVPDYDFISENGLRNLIWRISRTDEKERICGLMQKTGDLYIADGHHRVMASVGLCRKKREEHPDYRGDEPWNYLACVCFAEEELQILPYSRIVTGLNGLTAEAFLEACGSCYELQEEEAPAIPRKRGEIGLLLDGRWYRMTLREEFRPATPRGSLDADILQERILGPVLGIRDPRTCERLDFIGGGGQTDILISRCSQPGTAGFLLYPVSMPELFAVADAEETMPPKSTWFEPKLCNGLFLYRNE